jgi:hypothetical protein
VALLLVYLDDEFAGRWADHTVNTKARALALKILDAFRRPRAEVTIGLDVNSDLHTPHAVEGVVRPSLEEDWNALLCARWRRSDYREDACDRCCGHSDTNSATYTQ